MITLAVQLQESLQKQKPDSRTKAAFYKRRKTKHRDKIKSTYTWTFGRESIKVDLYLSENKRYWELKLSYNNKVCRIAADIANKLKQII